MSIVDKEIQYFIRFLLKFVDSPAKDATMP
jgi:hypothetical protein